MKRRSKGFRRISFVSKPCKCSVVQLLNRQSWTISFLMAAKLCWGIKGRSRLLAKSCAHHFVQRPDFESRF